MGRVGSGWSPVRCGGECRRVWLLGDVGGEAVVVGHGTGWSAPWISGASSQERDRSVGQSVSQSWGRTLTSALSQIGWEVTSRGRERWRQAKVCLI